MTISHRKASRLLLLGKILLGSLFIFLWFWHGEAQPPTSSPLGALSPRTGLLVKDDIIVRLIQHSSGDLAHDYVSRLALWDRNQVTAGYSQAAEWVRQKAEDFGLDQVAIERFPSDGKIEYLGNPTFPLWKVNKAELWVTSPFQMKLTSYAELPMSLARGSSSADVEAELVDIGAGTADTDFPGDIKGKIVLTSGNPGAVFARAVMKRGAAGIVSTWSVPDFDYLNRRPGDFPDQIGWPRIPADSGAPSSRFAFALSARRGQELKDLMREGTVLRIRAVVEAEFVPGNLEVVTGLIPGSIYPSDEVIVTAHLDHYKPGANDNASGSAAILEMARTMRQMIDNKELPQPLRTIRFIWIPEYNGTYAWLSAHLSDSHKCLAEFNFDMVGENVMKTNSVVALSYTSDSNPSYLNALVESIVDFVNKFNDERYPPQKDLYIGSIKGSRSRAAWRMAPFQTGTDHELFNNLKIGATTLTTWPDDFYHTSEDSPDKVDPTQLHRAVVLGLAAVTTLAYAGSEQALDLARLALIYGRKRISGSEFSAIRSLLSATKKDFAEADRQAGNLVSHLYRRERAAIGSSAALARTAKARSDIERTIAMLNNEEAASRKRIDDIAALRAGELNVARKPRPLTEGEVRASRLVPTRIQGKELFNFEYIQRVLRKDSTAHIQTIEVALNEASRRFRAQGQSELMLMGFPDAAAYYADGKRSILEIRDSVTAEYTPIAIEALELYFRAFEKAGVMKILEK